ncbi:MAG: hypothetical protein U0793_30705 [Gemmataceae bacterium]
MGPTRNSPLALNPGEAVAAVAGSSPLSSTLGRQAEGHAFEDASRVFEEITRPGVVIRDAGEVSSYLGQHPELRKLLPSICAEVRAALGKDVELSLEVYNDPEIDDRYVTLYVRESRYEADILDRLQKISDGFNHRLEDIPGYFLLTTDFSRPRGSHAV